MEPMTTDTLSEILEMLHYFEQKELVRVKWYCTCIWINKAREKPLHEATCKGRLAGVGEQTQEKYTTSADPGQPPIHQ